MFHWKSITWAWRFFGCFFGFIRAMVAPQKWNNSFIFLCNIFCTDGSQRNLESLVVMIVWASFYGFVPYLLGKSLNEMVPFLWIQACSYTPKSFMFYNLFFDCRRSWGSSIGTVWSLMLHTETSSPFGLWVNTDVGFYGVPWQNNGSNYDSSFHID